MKPTQEQRYRQDNWSCYQASWGNYESDKHKSRSILKEEIRDILVHGTYNKASLIVLKDTAKLLGFSEFIK